MKIFLIGLPGSGKSTVGRALAARLGVSFLDLDKEIEQHFGEPVSTIFSERGEEYFRKLESDILKERIEEVADFVMATGGGAPCFHQGIEEMNRAGLTVFLNVPTDVIAMRLTEHERSSRPLLAEKPNDVAGTLRNLHASRMPYYGQAKITVADEEILVEALLERLRSEG